MTPPPFRLGRPTSIPAASLSAPARSRSMGHEECMTTGVGTGRGARSGEWRRGEDVHGRPLPPIFPLELCPSFTTAGTVGLPPSFLLALTAVDCYIVRAQVRPNPPCVASPLASLLRSSRECAVSARRHASPRLPEETHAIHASVGSHTRDNATVSMRTCTFLVVCARLPEACMPLRRRVTVCSCLRLMYRCTPPAALRPVRALLPSSVRAAPPRGRCRRG